MNKDTKPKSNRLNVKEVAEILGISTATVYRLVETGELTKLKRPYGKIRVVFDADQVEALRQQAQV